MTKRPAAVILPADRPAALGIARSLGRRGIPVYCVDSSPYAVALLSKYVTPCVFQNSTGTDENRLDYLMDLGKKLGGKAVLFPVSDDEVILCSRERSILEKNYAFVMPDYATITDLVTKDGLHKIARACDIPDPGMFIASSEQEVSQRAGELIYPVILKPVISTSWLKPEIIGLLRDHPLSGPPKVALCRNAEELLETYRKIAVYDSRMVIQEVIPGEDERLAYFCCYLSRQSQPLAIFSGQKIRVLPVGFGSATYVRSFRDPALEEISLKLLSGCGYQGLGGIEFKKDPRDDRYKLIEFNARFGMWDSLSARCGVDIPYIAYQDALNFPVKAQTDYRENVLWVDFQRDIRAFFIYNGQKRLGVGRWLQSLRGEKDWAVFSPDDWKPVIGSMKELLERPLNVLKKPFSKIHRKNPSLP